MKTPNITDAQSETVRWLDRKGYKPSAAIVKHGGTILLTVQRKLTPGILVLDIHADGTHRDAMFDVIHHRTGVR